MGGPEGFDPEEFRDSEKFGFIAFWTIKSDKYFLNAKNLLEFEKSFTFWCEMWSIIRNFRY